MYKEIVAVRRLDTHIREFSSTLDKDLKKGNKEEALEYAKKFEKMIHKELNELFKLTEEDLKLYLLILRSLNSYKSKIYDVTGSDKFGLTDIEIKYAKTNIDSIREKLKGLKKIFNELK